LVSSYLFIWLWPDLVFNPSPFSVIVVGTRSTVVDA
jgi:hypothetical protein